MSDNPFKFFTGEQHQQPFLGSFDAFNKMWQETLQKTSLNAAPATATVEDLDKQIDALRNVENWLSLNLSVVKNTIQGLELQRANLQSFQEMMQKQDILQEAGQQWWRSLQEQFAGFLQSYEKQLSSTDTAAVEKTAEKSSVTPSDKTSTKPKRKPARKKG